MRTSLLTCAVIASCVPRSPDPGCFERHVRDAIAENERRRDLYGDVTDGRSVPISESLLRSERMTLIVARYFDLRARPYQRAGIPLLCDDFEDMAKAPRFVGKRSPRPRPYGKPPDIGEARRSLREAYAELGFRGVRIAADRLLERVARPAAYNCMVRHFLESIRRAATLAPRHARRSARQGLSPDDALGISWAFIDLHIAFLTQAHELDRRAAPLQRQGIPIICDDVPPIPALPDGDRSAH